MADFIETYRKTHTHPINRLLHTFGIPLIVLSILLVPVDAFLFSWKYWPLILTLFVLGWILQFIGHAFEGKPPAFFSNPIYLLVGVWWWVLKIFGIQSKKGDS